jgi:hypothetical protein
MFWSPDEDRNLEKRLRELIAQGGTLHDAIRTVHFHEGIGLILLCPPVERMSGLSPLEAKHLLIQLCPSELME